LDCLVVVQQKIHKQVNTMSETRKRARYTLELKMEAVRMVKEGQSASVTSKELGIPKPSLDNWVRLSAEGRLRGVNAQDVSQEQMEIKRLRAQLSRVTMERDILKLANQYFARESL
jgi:transposase